MSYAQGTTHYNFPQIAATDRPTFADANEAFRTLDTKLYALESYATEVDGRLDTAEGNIVELQNDVQTAQGTADTANGKGDTALEQISLTNTAVSQLTTRIGNKFDSVGIADPYDTAATYSVDDVVTYNGQRYRCTTAVTVAEPFDVTKWTGEDVETVLSQLKSDLGDISNYIDKNCKAEAIGTFDISVDGTNKTYKECIRTLFASVDVSKINGGSKILLITDNTTYSVLHFGQRIHNAFKFATTYGIGVEPNLYTLFVNNSTNDATYTRLTYHNDTWSLTDFSDTTFGGTLALVY